MSKGQQGDANVTYKLHLDKKGMELKQQMKFEDLEHRLSNLEKVLGTANVSCSCLRDGLLSPER